MKKNRLHIFILYALYSYVRFMYTCIQLKIHFILQLKKKHFCVQDNLYQISHQ